VPRRSARRAERRRGDNGVAMVPNRGIAPGRENRALLLLPVVVEPPDERWRRAGRRGDGGGRAGGLP